jgi:uncharacterized secreted protein with C-terminal beta-propeller domain
MSHLGNAEPPTSKRARMVEVIMGIEIFDDSIGQSIKAKLMNHAMTQYKTPQKQLEEAINRTHLIVECSRMSMVEALESEVSVMLFRNVDADEALVPISFIAGVMHAIDVLKGVNSIIDN